MKQEWLKLLSPKPFAEFSPSDFKDYIRTLYHKKAKKTPTIRLKKLKPTFVIKLTKTGKVSLKINRTPVWISREEITDLAQKSGIEERLIYLRITDKKRPIKISTLEAEEQKLST